MRYKNLKGDNCHRQGSPYFSFTLIPNGAVTVGMKPHHDNPSLDVLMNGHERVTVHLHEQTAADLRALVSSLRRAADNIEADVAEAVTT